MAITAPVLIVVLLAIAYLLGSLSGSLLLGRLRGVDIRTLGSGNAGGTNALRTQGWRFALGTVLIDIGKGALATALAAHWMPASAEPRVYEQDVDWVFHARGQVLSPQQVTRQVRALRRKGVAQLDTVPAAEPPLHSRCDF